MIFSEKQAEQIIKYWNQKEQLKTKMFHLLVGLKKLKAQRQNWPIVPTIGYGLRPRLLFSIQGPKADFIP